MSTTGTRAGTILGSRKNGEGISAMSRLSGIDDPEFEASLRKKARRRAPRPPGWAVLLICIVSIGLILTVAEVCGFSRYGWCGRYGPIVVGAVVSALLVGWLERRGERRELTSLLRWMPHRCTRCGYDVRSLSGERCPECGQPLGRRAATGTQGKKVNESEEQSD